MITEKGRIRSVLIRMFSEHGRGELCSPAGDRRSPLRILAPNLAGLAEYREDICVGGSAAVYIKNIIPDKMKVKLVIVDTFPAPETKEKSFDYKIEAGHIDKWVYSPEECSRVIETVFE